MNYFKYDRLEIATVNCINGFKKRDIRGVKCDNSKYIYDYINIIGQSVSQIQVCQVQIRDNVIVSFKEFENMSFT
nr:unnamed protein product [Callosobruchus analis]